MKCRVQIPEKINVEAEKNFLSFSHSKEKLLLQAPPFLNLDFDKKRKTLTLSIKRTFLKKTRVLKKLVPILFSFDKKVKEAIFGLSKGFIGQVSLSGLGFKIEKLDNRFFLKLGYSHITNVVIPNEIVASCPKDNLAVLKSASKEVLKSFIKTLQKHKYPDVYKNKGILIKGETLLKKKFKKK